jgi:sulfite reductase alpha subunit-like flavoprotein
MYYGERGYLGLHQKKVYGFMLVGLSAGRNHTNGGTLKASAQSNAVQQLDSEFDASRKERAMHIQTNYPLKLRVKQAIMMGDEARYIVLDAQNQIFKLWPGDKMSILPKNSNNTVIELMDDIKHLLESMPKLLRYKANLTNSKWRKFIEEQDLETNLNSVEDLLRIIFTYGDLRIRAFKQFKEENNIDLIEIKSDDFKSYIHEISHAMKLEKREVFLTFLDWIIETLTPMNHRYYSVCTSPRQLEDSGEIGICVGLLKYKSGENTILGTCSSYLHSIQVGEFVEARPVFSYWNVPTSTISSSLSHPIIMIAGGTGLAPMMSLIKARANAGYFNNHLFFVTKNSNAFYFRQELEELVSTQKLNIYGAFTRDSVTCPPLIKRVNTNITTLLLTQRKFIAFAIAKQSACVYICGRVEFARKCDQTLVEMLLDDGKGEAMTGIVKKENAAQLLVNMRHNGKYVEEVFTSYCSESATDEQNTSKLKEICITDVLSNDNYFVLRDHVYDVTEFKRVHPGGDYVFLVASESDYDQVHANDVIVQNRLQSLLVGRVQKYNDFVTEDLEEFSKLKKLIGKYYCATDIPASERTASLLVEHQSSFVQNFHEFFAESHIEALHCVANHAKFKESVELIKVLMNNSPSQDFVAFLWEKVEMFNFDFLFSLRKHLLCYIREENSKTTSFDIYQNPYEKFYKFIFSFRKTTTLKHRNSLKTIGKSIDSSKELNTLPLIKENKSEQQEPNGSLSSIFHYFDLALFYSVFALFFLFVPWSLNLKVVISLIFGTIYSAKLDKGFSLAELIFFKFNQSCYHIKALIIFKDFKI